jgi:hypothetical protein
MAELVLAEARRRFEEALSPDTPAARVAALVVEELRRTRTSGPRMRAS